MKRTLCRRTAGTSAYGERRYWIYKIFNSLHCWLCMLHKLVRAAGWPGRWCDV